MAESKTIRKAKNVEYVRRWRRARPDYMHELHIKKKYGMSIETYRALVAAQGGRCAICTQPAADKHPGKGKGVRGLNVDHDHVTGRIRGLLCLPCNIGLGGFKDDPKRLIAAIGYLGGVPSRTF